MQEHFELTSEVLEAAELEEQPIAMLEAPATETIGSPPLPDLGLDTIEEFYVVQSLRTPSNSVLRSCIQFVSIDCFPFSAVYTIRFS